MSKFDRTYGSTESVSHRSVTSIDDALAVAHDQFQNAQHLPERVEITMRYVVVMERNQHTGGWSVVEPRSDSDDDVSTYPR